jgi:hypothetical protein
VYRIKKLKKPPKFKMLYRHRGEDREYVTKMEVAGRGWRISHNEDLHDFHSSPNTWIFWLIKTTMIWTLHVACDGRNEECKYNFSHKTCTEI